MHQTDDSHTLRRLVFLLALTAGVCLAAGASRMAPPAWQLHTFGDVLRIREAFSMFLFAPALALLFWLVLRCLARDRPHPFAQALAILAVYFIACGMGMHDPVNRMTSAYAPVREAMPPAIWNTWEYLDDRLGHWIFWAGFVLATWTAAIQQILAPFDAPIPRPWRAVLLAIAAALLAVMLTNLWDEYPKTLADLCVIFLAAALPLALHLTRRAPLARLPLLWIVYPAYFGSIAGTLACWAVRGLLTK